MRPAYSAPGELPHLPVSGMWYWPVLILAICFLFTRRTK